MCACVCVRERVIAYMCVCVYVCISIAATSRLRPCSHLSHPLKLAFWRVFGRRLKKKGKRNGFLTCRKKQVPPNRIRFAHGEYQEGGEETRERTNWQQVSSRVIAAETQCPK